MKTTYKATINFYLLKEGNPVIPECLRLFRKHAKKFFVNMVVRQMTYDITEKYGFYLAIIIIEQMEFPKKLDKAEVIVEIHNMLKPKIESFMEYLRPKIDHYTMDIDIK